jgi:hypothetical protein
MCLELGLVNKNMFGKHIISINNINSEFHESEYINIIKNINLDQVIFICMC